MLKTLRIFKAGMWLALVCCSANVAAQTLTEYQVKAAYLYNFAKFVKWPVGAQPAGATFNICILGTNPFGNTLASTVADEKLDGKSIALHQISTPAEATDCAIVYIGRSEQSRLSSLLPALAKQGVLTVSEAPRFSAQGGIIGFVMDGGRVRFEVNLAAAQKAGLTLSSELLKVAMNVRRTPEPGGHQ